MTEPVRRAFLKASLAALAAMTGVVGCGGRALSCYVSPVDVRVGQALNRSKLIEQLKELAESTPPTDLSSGAFCYAPPEGGGFNVIIPCPDCGQGELVLPLSPSSGPYLSETGDARFRAEFRKRFPDEASMSKANLGRFLRTRVRRNPALFTSLGGYADIFILREYEKHIRKVRELGLDATLVVPPHCPRCGHGLTSRKREGLYSLRNFEFPMVVRYPDHPEPVRVQLDSPGDLDLMAVFLEGKDRFCLDDTCYDEVAVKDLIERLRRLFGIDD